MAMRPEEYRAARSDMTVDQRLGLKKEVMNAISNLPAFNSGSAPVSTLTLGRA